MSKIITKTALTTLLTLAAIAPSVPTAAQEAIMLESRGFVRMVQPEPPRQIPVPPQWREPADQRQHASAE